MTGRHRTACLAKGYTYALKKQWQTKHTHKDIPTQMDTMQLFILQVHRTLPYNEIVNIVTDCSIRNIPDTNMCYPACILSMRWDLQQKPPYPVPLENFMDFLSIAFRPSRCFRFLELLSWKQLSSLYKSSCETSLKRWFLLSAVGHITSRLRRCCVYLDEKQLLWIYLNSC